MLSNNFSSLPLTKSMLHNLNELGMVKMTPVQAESLPHIIDGKDLIAQAKTGSGKTAAFGIALIHRLNTKLFDIQSLIICPTRELADQVAKEIRRLARLTNNIKVLTLSGGVPFRPQQESLRHGAHIVVGTPGRILKHLDKGGLNLQHISTLVLDEADRMLDMGFIDEISKLIAATPTQRQTLLFSATYPNEIIELSSSIQKNAVSVKSISSEPANKIDQYFYELSTEDKFAALIKILSHHKPMSAIIFSNTKVECKKVAENLTKRGVNALALHGDLEQYQRTDVLVQFANKSCPILVATDVAARGIDIEELGMVINYDLPHDEESYIHRIGRTGRAGKEGVAATIFTVYEARKAEVYDTPERNFKKIDELDGSDTSPLNTLSATNKTLVIEAGKKSKMRPGDILGALTGDGGVTGKDVGKIEIHDRQSFVAIENSQFENALRQLKRHGIKGRKFKVWILSE